ncbi:PTS system, cellobiose-specific IIC component [Alkalibacterium sp. AK22]|nr:PTS system, cellobiose-specific IIC component [Alkalibacterium sp. AK22]
MIEKFLVWLEEKFMPPMARLAEQRHLKAVRDGVISTLPLIIVGSFFIILAQPPVEALQELVAPYVGDIMIPFRMTVGLMSVYAAYGMGYSLARSYKLDGVSGGVLSLATFLMMNVPLNVDGVLNEAMEAGIEGADPIGFVLPMGNLGGAGMFTAILSMIVAVEIMRFMTVRNFTLTMPEQVPDSVARSFEALFPATVVIVFAWIVRVMLGFDINELMMSIFSPLIEISGNNYFGVMLPVLLVTVLWAAGIHGMSVIGSVMRPAWLVMLDANIEAVADGGAMTFGEGGLPYIAPEPFYQWYVWVGGAGATLALAILLVFSKSAYLKQVGKFSIIPGLFNINEPMIFGAPIVMNPILAIPFILAPVVTTTISYFAVYFGLVSGLTIMAPWTLPAPIGAWMASGGSFAALLLVLINIAVALGIYYPFFKVYEKKMIEEENAEIQEKQKKQATRETVTA